MINKPAAAGGLPVRSRMLPLAAAEMTIADIQAVTRVLSDGELGSGDKVTEFETAVAEYVGAKYAVAVSSGAAGLHVALMSAAVGHEDEVITTPLTHPATSNCILYQNGIHTFVDVEPTTYNLDPVKVKHRITGRTRALIPVHFAGNPCELDLLHFKPDGDKMRLVAADSISVLRPDQGFTLERKRYDTAESEVEAEE